MTPSRFRVLSIHPPSHTPVQSPTIHPHIHLYKTTHHWKSHYVTQSKPTLANTCEEIEEMLPLYKLQSWYCIINFQQNADWIHFLFNYHLSQVPLYCKVWTIYYCQYFVYFYCKLLIHRIYICLGDMFGTMVFSSHNNSLMLLQGMKIDHLEAIQKWFWSPAWEILSAALDISVSPKKSSRPRWKCC